LPAGIALLGPGISRLALASVRLLLGARRSGRHAVARAPSTTLARGRIIRGYQKTPAWVLPTFAP
jgi:hypothetical protein